jgi:hypothetical protein
MEENLKKIATDYNSSEGIDGKSVDDLGPIAKVRYKINFFMLLTFPLPLFS